VIDRLLARGRLERSRFAADAIACPKQAASGRPCVRCFRIRSSRGHDASQTIIHSKKGRPRGGSRLLPRPFPRSNQFGDQELRHAEISPWWCWVVRCLSGSKLFASRGAANLSTTDSFLQNAKNVRDSSNGASESDFVPRSFKRSWDCVQIGSKTSSLICYSDVAAMVHGN
jgi:hypothetical protein